MLYRLEQKIDGGWKFLKEVTNVGSWMELRQMGKGSFRLIDPLTGLVVRELHHS